MTGLLIAAGVLLAALLLLGVWWLVRRRSPATEMIARDEPAASATLSGGLAVTRRTLGARLAALLSRGPDAADWEALEEALLEADVGVAATTAISERLQSGPPQDADGLRAALRAELLRMLGAPTGASACPARRP